MANATKKMSAEAESFKRGKGLVDNAIKASKESVVAIRDGFAAAVFHAVKHGRCDLLNMLYTGMERKDSEAMRVWAIPEIGVIFDAAAEKTVDDDGNERWTVKPVSIFGFKMKPDESKGENHFTILSNKPKDNADTATIAKHERVKAIKDAILKVGEDSLKFEWVRSEIMGKTQPFGQTQAIKAVYNTLLRIAKAGPVTGFSRDQLKSMAVTAGLRQDEVSKIVESYPVATPQAPRLVEGARDTTEETPAETEPAESDEREAKAA